MKSRPAVFLDRDGVINETIFRDGKPRSPGRIEDFQFFPGVIDAVHRLKAAGYLAIVVTNQPDVARGWLALEAVEAMNGHVRDALGVDDIKVCYHIDEHGCLCRKPLPGMLLEAARDWNIELATSFMVGDRYGDVSAGKAAGCATVLVGPGDSAACVEPDFRAKSLAEAAEWILERSKPPSVSTRGLPIFLE